jgi:hypothetical protein
MAAEPFRVTTGAIVSEVVGGVVVATGSGGVGGVLEAVSFGEEITTGDVFVFGIEFCVPSGVLVAV